MKLPNDENYRVIGEYDISAIKEEVLNLTEEDWNLDITRQNIFKGVHHMTQCYFVMGFPLNWDGVGYPSERNTTKLDSKIYS